MTDSQFDRYLRLLGVEPEPPGLAALTRLVRAHLYRIPFENVSKLINKRHLGLTGLPTLDRYLDGIEQQHFGGTCYTTNYYLSRLLDRLGYRVKLCGAAMSQPDVHMVSLVTLDDREFLVDVGYAAPFDFPIPRDRSDDYEIVQRGDDRYVLRPQDAAGASQVDLIRAGQLRHGYRINPAPRQIEEFNAVIAQSFQPEATFMNALLLTRFGPNHSRVVHNLTALDITGDQSAVQRLADREELVAYVEQHFGIAPDVLRDALAALGDLTVDAW